MSGPSQLARAALAYSAQLAVTDHQPTAMRRAAAIVRSHTTRSGRPAVRALPSDGLLHALEHLAAPRRNVTAVNGHRRFGQLTLQLSCGHFVAVAGELVPDTARCPQC